MPTEAIIELKEADICQKEQVVLKEINLTIGKGEFVYLIGKTGSGKSSLLKTLYAELPLKKGEAKAVGFDLKKLKKKEIPYLRRQLGIVFQDFQLLTDRTVQNNLLFVLKATGWKDKKKMQQQIDQVLDLVGMSRKGYKMPHELSGGEQQRIAIARSLLNDPELILADEPTGNLDPETSNALMNLLCEIKDKGTTIVMATHNMQLVESFPGRILNCKEGNLCEDNS